MSTNAISSYLTTYNASTSSAKSADSENTTLSMDDFIKLLVAQLENQDMNNTTDTSELVAQMAQYSMVEAINSMSEQSKVASSFNLIGKGATVATTDANGNKTYAYGVVDGVTINSGEVDVVISGKSYSMDDVTEVYDASLLKTNS